jgi:hypothetical protein
MSRAEIGRQTERFRALGEKASAERRPFQDIEQSDDAIALRGRKRRLVGRWAGVQVGQIGLELGMDPVGLVALQVQRQFGLGEPGFDRHAEGCDTGQITFVVIEGPETADEAVERRMSVGSRLFESSSTGRKIQCNPF